MLKKISARGCNKCNFICGAECNVRAPLLFSWSLSRVSRNKLQLPMIQFISNWLDKFGKAYEQCANYIIEVSLSTSHSLSWYPNLHKGNVTDASNLWNLFHAEMLVRSFWRYFQSDVVRVRCLRGPRLPLPKLWTFSSALHVFVSLPLLLLFAFRFPQGSCRVSVAIPRGSGFGEKEFQAIEEIGTKHFLSSSENAT